MKNESVGRRHEGWRALWFAIAGVMAVMLAWNVLVELERYLVLICRQARPTTVGVSLL